MYRVNIWDMRITVMKTLTYMFWIAIMAVLYYETEVIIRSASLYIVSTARLEQIDETGIDLCIRLPGIAFYGVCIRLSSILRCHMGLWQRCLCRA